MTAAHDRSRRRVDRRRRPATPVGSCSGPASSASCSRWPLLVVVTAIVNPRFLSGQSIRDILLGTAILAVLAVGQAVVVITRNIDLSVGSVLGLSRLRRRHAAAATTRACR